MTSLLIIHASDGRTYECGPACYNATAERTDCLCAAMNYGAGFSKARFNTTTHWQIWIRRWERDHKPASIRMIDLRGLERDLQPELEP